MASSAPNISPKALRIFRRYHFVRYWGKKVMFIVYNLSFLHGQKKTIYEILNHNGIPLGKKSFFNAQEVNNLMTMLPEDLDITVMNKICQALWQKGVNDPGAEIKDLVKKIKDERNIVSHEDVDISNADLKMKLDDFHVTLKEILDEAKLKFPHYAVEIDQLKSDIKDALPKLLQKIREKWDLSKPDELKCFQKEIDEHVDELSDYIREKARGEFLSLYVNLCKVLPFDWLAQYDILDPCEFMVYLKMDQEDWGRQGSTCVTIDQNEILEIKDSRGRDPKAVIICGDAGSGKTTILCSIVEKWHKDTRDMPELSSYQILLYMQFRNHNHENFDEYIQSFLPKTVSLFEFKHIKSTILGSKCLVLCDGYDEANKKSAKLFEEILSLNSTDMKIVVTTRPGSAERLTNIVNKGRCQRINLRLLGLQNQDMNSLIKTLIGHLVPNDLIRRKEMITELFQELKQMDDKTMVILRTPLLFNLYILLYVECPNLRNEIKTMTAIYIQLKKHTIKRIADKTGISMDSLTEFDGLYKEWSLNSYIDETYEWSQAIVDRFKSKIKCQEVLDNFEVIMSSFFSVKHTSNNLDIEKVHCYKHRSVQEFEVASFVCDEIVKSGRSQNGNTVLNVLKSKGILKDLNPTKKAFKEVTGLVSFITGILYNTKKDVLYDIINDIHELYKSNVDFFTEFDYILVSCLETRLDSKVLESLVSLLRESPAKKQTNIRKSDSLFALPSLLPELKPKRVKLFEIPRDLSTLNETLQTAYQHKIRIEFELHLRLMDISEFSGQILHPVERLELEIDDHHKEAQDLGALHPISLEISANQLKASFIIQSPDVNYIAQVINRTVPSDRADDTTELWIVMGNGEYRFTVTDMKRLIESLTVRPLRSITICTKSGAAMATEELKTLCIQKGLGKLCIIHLKA